MSKSDKHPSSPLMAAASALDEQLQRFEQLTETLEGSVFNSQKTLERAAKVLSDVADVDEQLTARVKDLVSAISVVRERQQAQADRVQARAQELQRRTAVYQDLMLRYEALGKITSELNGLMEQLPGKQNLGGSDSGGELVKSLQELHEPMGKVVDGATDLHQAANETGFPDIARQADALKQQLLAARNRLNLFHASLRGA